MDVGAVNRYMAGGTSLITGIDHAVSGMVGVRDAAIASHAEVAGACMALQAKHGRGRTGK